MSAYPITSVVEIEGVSLDPGKLSLTDGTFSTTIRPDDATTSYDLLLPPQAGTVGQALVMSSATETDWETAPENPKQIWVITDTETSGTNGRAYTISPDIRDLNTITGSPTAGTDVQLAVAPAGANEILIQPGDYIVYGKVPLVRDSSGNILFKAVFWNQTTSSVQITGTSGISADTVQTSSYFFSNITLAVQTVFSVRLYQNSPAVTSLGGYATNIAGVSEVYSLLYIEKIE